MTTTKRDATQYRLADEWIRKDHVVENFRIADTAITAGEGALLLTLRLQGSTRSGTFGPFILDGQNSAAAGPFITEILEVVRVHAWEQLKGKFVRGAIEQLLSGDVVCGIGHVVENRWLIAREFFARNTSGAPSRRDTL